MSDRAKGKLGEPQWPPRSPHEVLLSTPGGRERLRRIAERSSPSPSPVKRSKSNPSLINQAQILLPSEIEDEDEDDEEMLQLQLQEIQARLKLKKLQKKHRQTSDSENESNRNDVAQCDRSRSVATSRAESRLAGIRAIRLETSKVQSDIAVPVSPVRRTRPPEMQRSPGRVLLGIDKGLKGSDISLKRAPSLRKREEDRLAGPFLQRPKSQIRSRIHGQADSTQPIDDKPMSFSERLIAMRGQDVERQDRELRIKKNRSQAFDIDQEQMQDYKENAIVLPEAPRQAEEFNREDVLMSAMEVKGMTRSKTAPELKSTLRSMSSGLQSSTPVSEYIDSQPLASSSNSRPTVPKKPPDQVMESEATYFDPYSSQHLSKRIIPHQRLTRTLAGKKNFRIPDLLKIVKGPDFSGPDIEEDVVVFAIIASKSEPKSHQAHVGSKSQKRGKFMAMTLTDLKWELDLFLFDSAFDKFWKMTPGTVIAILNPMFMAPPRSKIDTGKFSLTLNSDGDTVLEIGSASYLGFCKSIRKDGKTCDAWVDKRHTEFCDFHVNQSLQKTHASRMEVNSMNFGKGNYGGGSKALRNFNSADVTNRPGRKTKEDTEKTRYDKGSHSHIFIGKRTTANLLDDVDYDPDAFHRGSSKEERMTRRLLAQEKERELERKLGVIGNGIGADYARIRRQASLQSDAAGSSSNLSSTSSQAQSQAPPTDAMSLGLLSAKATDIALSPIKRKRTNTISGSAAVGWGSNLSKELGRMKDGESLQPPVKKKTRFVTAKGIREAGRESFGGEVVVVAGDTLANRAATSHHDDVDDNDDDDDDLDIVRG